MIHWWVKSKSKLSTFACVFFSVHTKETFFKHKAWLRDAFRFLRAHLSRVLFLTHHKHLGDIILLVFSITGNRWNPGTPSRPRSMEVNDRATAQDDCEPLTSERWCGLWGCLLPWEEQIWSIILLNWSVIKCREELCVSFCQRKKSLRLNSYRVNTYCRYSMQVFTINTFSVMQDSVPQSLISLNYYFFKPMCKSYGESKLLLIIINSNCEFCMRCAHYY